jgi:hypothetical protein
MDEQLQVPVAFCPTCNDDGPVVVRTLNPEEFGEIESEITIIYCPGCSNILNGDGPVNIKWYSLEELYRVTGWKWDG